LSQYPTPVAPPIQNPRSPTYRPIRPSDYLQSAIISFLDHAAETAGSLLRRPPDIGLLGLGRVQAELEAILGTKIDLVPASDLKPTVRARAERDLVAL
jgi:hypothetical protein